MVKLTNEVWANQFATMSKWVNDWPDSAEVNTSIFRNWIRWLDKNGGPVAGFDPDELANYQEMKLENGSKRVRYLLLDKALEYIQANEGKWRLGYQRRILSSIRSFFDSNRVSLPEDKTMWRKVENVPHIEGAPEKLVTDLETLRTILVKCNKMYRALFMAMFAGGMGIGEVLEWSSQGVAQIGKNMMEEDGVKLLHIEIPSRKGNNKEFYTVIGGDSLSALEKYLEERRRAEGRFKRRHPDKSYPESIFVTNLNTPLDDDTTVRTYWLRKLHQLGIIDRSNGKASTRYGYNPHQLRDCFKTQVHGKMDKDVAEFMMGHSIDSNKYDQFYKNTDYVYNEYIKALPYLNVLNSDLPFGKADATEVQRQAGEIIKLKSQVEILQTERDTLLSDIRGFSSQQHLLNERLERMEKIMMNQKALKEHLEVLERVAPEARDLVSSWAPSELNEEETEAIRKNLKQAREDPAGALRRIKKRDKA